MIFRQTPMDGAFVVEPERQTDERGWFARTFCAEEFADRKLCATFAQCSTSFNAAAGTLRGMHYQADPHAEIKLVRVTRGAIYDVIVDLRKGSSSYARWFGIELTAANGKMLYVPEGFAHGFQTLEDDTEVYYQINTPYVANAARGVRWNDPAFNITWPATANRTISARDAGFRNFT
jgi:dTDP-4-dehydrorhamnose 3,5-epimerase